MIFLDLLSLKLDFHMYVCRTRSGRASRSCASLLVVLRNYGAPQDNRSTLKSFHISLSMNILCNVRIALGRSAIIFCTMPAVPIALICRMKISETKRAKHNTRCRPVYTRAAVRTGSARLSHVPSQESSFFSCLIR